MPNYIVSPANIPIYDGQVLSSQTINLTITPSAGYAISATDFSIGGSSTESPVGTFTGGNVDTDVLSVVFSDNGTPGASTNTVNVAVSLDGFTASVTASTINIDIDAGDIRPVDGRQVCISTITPEAVTETISNTNATGITSASSTHPTTSAVTHNHSGIVSGSGSYLVLTKNFQANSNYYYPWPGPSGVISGGSNPSNIYNQVVTNTYTSGQLTGRTIKVYYTPPTPNLDISNICELGHKITFSASTRFVEGTAADARYGQDGINSLVMVSGDISPNGETRSLKVYGNVAQTYNLTIKDNSADTYDFTTSGVFSSAVTGDGDRAIPTVTGYGSDYGFYEYQIVFPSTSASKTFDVSISAGDTTPVMDTSLPTATYPSTPSLRLYQAKHPVITFNVRSLDNEGVYTRGANATSSAFPGYVARVGSTTDGVINLSMTALAKGTGTGYNLALARQPVESDFTQAQSRLIGSGEGCTASTALLLSDCTGISVGMRVTDGGVGTITPSSTERYVTVTNVTNTQITLSSVQTLTTNDIVVFNSNAVASIDNISAVFTHTGENPDEITITATATIISYGLDDVDILLDLDNFVTIT
tara:strand:+ start:7422 stop:9191 length:1770 start_codon:yes stop_codon:yes gene_type:complete